jgi:hypothetical protein
MKEVSAMKRLLIFCLFSLAFSAAQAQTSPRNMAEAFLGSIAQGQMAAGYNKLFEGSNIAKDKGQGGTIRKQTEAALPPLGKVLGFELIREEPFGTSLVRLVYLLKSERHLTSWEFYFYKPKNTWFVAEINFSDKFHLLDTKN